MASPNCPYCHGTGVAGGHWLGDRWCDHDCRPVEGVWSVPGELIDPANVDYAAATRVMRSWLVEDNDAPLLSAVRWAVDAALGVGETAEGNEE